ncbi:MAG: 6-hydroxymethylpterin diphosphokinase MptE-like protein [Methylobacter sp.]
MYGNNSLIATNDIGPIKTNIFGEKYFYNLNRDSFDKISSQAQFDAKFSNNLFQPNSLNIIIGTDSGLLPLYLQQKGLPKGTRYIFIEPASILEQLINHQLLEALDPAIVCITLDEWEETTLLFKIQDYIYINGVQSFNSFCAEDDNCNTYAELSWHITEVLAQSHWDINMTLGNETFTSHHITNLADNLLPAKLLNNTFHGKTVVLLAGGPSLDEALPWVQKHRQQIVIFAVSRISRQLKNINLEPDFIFSVDPTELSFDISKEMLTFSNRPVFVYAYHAVPTLVSQWQGVGLYLGPRIPWKSTLNYENISGAGPTVTNTALSIAHSFGFKRIILAGVDLCFTRDGYTHANGSDEHIAGPRFNLTSLKAETNGGFMAPTSCDLATAINTLALQAKIITATGCQIINPSANAAKVNNIDYIPLDDFKLDDNPVNVAAIIAKQIPPSSHRPHNNPATGSELKRAQFQINAILRLAKNALTINESMYSAQGVIENYKDKRQLDKIEKKLNRDHRQYSKLVKRFGIRNFLKITKPFTDEDWSAEEAKEIGNTYYEAYRDGAITLLKLINDAMERTRSRQEEISDEPDFNLLLNQWRKDRSFARAKLWKQNHPHTNIPASVQTEFNELEKLFASILVNKNTTHMARAKSFTSFSMLKKRAALLFKHQKTQELKDLLSGLHKHEEQTAAVPYVYLINGYLAELQDDTEAAISAYHNIIDSEDSPLLEEALLRIAVISINTNDTNNTNAYLSLQCLSQINPFYLPFYAEIVRLRGDTLTAIDAYNHYISRFSEDILVQMKLTMLYIENKTYDAAELMLDHILTNTPDSKTAIDLKKRLAYLKTLN